MTELTFHWTMISDNDLRNHIYMAKRAIQLSCLDQENAVLKIEQWRKTDPDSTHFFLSVMQGHIQ